MRPQRPPSTPREALHLLFGDEHIDHSVAEYELVNLGSVVKCTCGHKRLIGASEAQRAGVAPSEVRHALRNAPRKPTRSPNV